MGRLLCEFLVVVLAASPVDEAAWRVAPPFDSGKSADTVASLVELAGRSSTPLEQFDRRVAVANVMLAALAEPATRLLLGAPAPDDAALVQRVVQDARAQLEVAGELWSKLAEDESLPRSARWERQGQLDGLRAFARTFAVLWSPESTDDADRPAELSGAAGDLAILLEDQRPEVARAARLWQAQLYVMQGDRTRALDLLPPVLSGIEDGSTYGFYARLIRGREAAAAVGGYAAAVAVLARFEARCDAWFGGDQRRRAQCTAGLIRRQLTAAWADKCLRSDDAAGAAECERSIRKIDEQYFAGSGPTELLRLGDAIPLLADVQAALGTGRPPGEPTGQGEAVPQGSEVE